MGTPSSVYALASAALLSCFASSCAAMENCLFQLTPPEAPYYVLGTRVTPQSNIMVVDDCEKTVEEVRSDLLAPKKEHEPPVQALELQRQVRVLGEALARRRDEAARERERDNGVVQGLLDWLWSWTTEFLASNRRLFGRHAVPLPDPLGNKLLQLPEIAIIDTVLGQLGDCLVEIFGATAVDAA